MDLKGKAGRSRRSSSLGAGSALPHITRVRSGGQLGAGGGLSSVSPVPGYKQQQQLYSERSSPVERHRSPSAAMDYKAKSSLAILSFDMFKEMHIPQIIKATIYMPFKY